MKTIDVRKNDVSTKDTVQVIFGEADEYLLHHANNRYFSIIDDDGDEILIYVTDIPKMVEALSALHAFIQQENHQ